MFTFAYPKILFFLLLIPFFTVLYILMRRSRAKKFRIFGKHGIPEALMPNVSSTKPLVKFVLLMAALFCIIFCAARPWGGVVSTTGTSNGMEVVLTVDASNSMLASATGNPDDVSRMTTAKVTLERLIGNLSNDKVGLVVFAGQAYQLIPTSSDFASAKSFLNSISPEEIPVPGTDIAAAIEVAEATFSDNKEVSKAIILLTDVEELDDEEGAIKAVKNAASKGIQVNVIGVGSSDAVTIPYKNGVFRDDNGQIVHTRLNADLGKKLAEAGNGVYVNAGSKDALSMIQKQMRSLRQSQVSSNEYALHEELYIFFAIAALFFLVVEGCLSNGKNRLFDKLALFRKRPSVRINGKRHS